MAEIATDVKDQAEIVTAPADPSPAETNDDGVFFLDAGEQPTDKVNEPKKTEEDAAKDGNPAETSGDKGSVAETEETPRKNAETRKQQLNNEIRDKIAERNALREEIAELNRQKYQMKSESDIPTVEALLEQINPETGDYYTRTEAKLARIEAERKLEATERNMERYTERVVDNLMRLKDESNRVLKEFPIFDDTSPSYNPELAKQAEKIAGSLIIRDGKTGNIIGAHGSIYDVYATIANAANAAKLNGEIAGRQAALTMANAADVVGTNSAGNAASDDDPFLDGMKLGMR